MSATLRYEDKPVVKPKHGKQLPDPCGYMILLGLPEVQEKTEGGIVIPDERRSAEEGASVIGYVMALGPDCYTDKVKFPSGPWCKKGDWVVIRPYAGTRLQVYDKEFRLINDDTVEAVVENPSGVFRK
jgi:co-chaperonin GroES (HSP10)